MFRRSLRAGVAATVALALALGPMTITGVPDASAAKQGTPGALEIEVLSFSSNDAVEEAQAFTDAFKHALIEAPGMFEHVAAGKGHALEAVLLTVNCEDATTPACAAKVAAEIKHDRFLFGTIKRSPPNKLTATLSYYNKGEIKTVAKTYDAGPASKDGTAPELKVIALDALYAMTGGPPKSKVDVVVTGPGANEAGDIYEGANKVGHVEGGKTTLELAAGKHTLELRVSGYSTSTADVDLGADPTSVQFTPVKLAPTKPLDWQLYGGIGAIAVGAVFVGVGVATSLSIKDAQDDPTFNTYRHRFPASVGDTCAEAKAGHEGTTSGGDKLAPTVSDLCDSVSRKQKMQFVWYGLGAVFIGGGAVLIATDKKGGSEGEAPKTASGSNFTLKVQPTVGPNFNALSIVGAF